MRMVCMLKPSPGFRKQPRFSVTVPAPVLDMVSSPRAKVAQLLSALQTGQIQALTGLVCGERLSPDAALTLPPSAYRIQKLTMLELITPQPDLVGPVGLPRTDWSLTMA
ncbi:unnamed protein product [Pleuronectes platessa]|uniref:Uncharacterized protein n=1 Tax=Pleuronectes platessa TaxID=8262 RepID=A0A9N7VVB7_PLEPL|nr:unnamed protein product [Pleuronectes platessa]